MASFRKGLLPGMNGGGKTGSVTEGKPFSASPRMPVTPHQVEPLPGSETAPSPVPFREAKSRSVMPRTMAPPGKRMPPAKGGFPQRRACPPTHENPRKKIRPLWVLIPPVAENIIRSARSPSPGGKGESGGVVSLSGIPPGKQLPFRPGRRGREEVNSPCPRGLPGQGIHEPRLGKAAVSNSTAFRAAPAMEATGPSPGTPPGIERIRSTEVRISSVPWFCPLRIPQPCSRRRGPSRGQPQAFPPDFPAERVHDVAVGQQPSVFSSNSTAAPSLRGVSRPRRAPRVRRPHGKSRDSTQIPGCRDETPVHEKPFACRSNPPPSRRKAGIGG